VEKPHPYCYCVYVRSAVTCRRGSHNGVPKQWNGGHACVPNQSYGGQTLFLCKHCLVSINFHGCWPREWKRRFISCRPRLLSKFILTWRLRRIAAPTYCWDLHFNPRRRKCFSCIFSNERICLCWQKLEPRPHYAGEIWKRNDHRSFWICVWGKHGQVNRIIIVKPSFSKSSDSKMFLVFTKTQSRRFKFLRFKERFRKASFSWRICVDGRPNRTIKATFFRFFRRSVDAV